jgi:hypothetical protein
MAISIHLLQDYKTSFSSALLSKSDMSVLVGMYIDLHLVLGYPYVWIYLPHLWSTVLITKLPRLSNFLLHVPVHKLLTIINSFN